MMHKTYWVVPIEDVYDASNFLSVSSVKEAADNAH